MYAAIKYRALPHLHEFDLIVVHFLTKPQVKAPTQKMTPICCQTRKRKTLKYYNKKKKKKTNGTNMLSNKKKYNNLIFKKKITPAYCQEITADCYLKKYISIYIYIIITYQEMTADCCYTK